MTETNQINRTKWIELEIEKDNDIAKIRELNNDNI